MAKPEQNNSSPPLVKYDAARKALAEAHRVDEVKLIHNKAIAVAVYAKLAKDEQMVLMATEIKLRAERRTGELLQEMQKVNGARGTGSNQHRKVESPREYPTTKLSDLGISKNESSTWQKLAKIPEAEFEKRLNVAKENLEHLTTKKILAVVPVKRERVEQEDDPHGSERASRLVEMLVRAFRSWPGDEQVSFLNLARKTLDNLEAVALAAYLDVMDPDLYEGFSEKMGEWLGALVAEKAVSQ